MNEIDLIPELYRKQRLFNQWIKHSIYLLAGISVTVIVMFIFLQIQTETIDHQLKELQTQKAISTQQRNKLEKLNSRKVDLMQQLDLLAGLRSGSAAEQMFITVDRAISKGDVWFTNWRFRRAGTAVDKDPKTVNTGYFIVIPNGKKEQEKETWKIETHMSIRGQAMDHAALSEFVSNLIRQPEIQHVRVVRTDLVRLYETKLVNFILDVVVSAGGV
ncbi:MAG: hypothetical protein LC541_18840 [Candidatus Thiodiazotropha sp.]|nr:hypothetical protein [Candidatus Thiodiazotropha sp.]MCM8885326.1 hypothetical protein [Candidatus Thiodiazotropha sp.]